MNEQLGLNRDQPDKGELLTPKSTGLRPHKVPQGTSPPQSQVSGHGQSYVDSMPGILLGISLWPCLSPRLQDTQILGKEDPRTLLLTRCK